MLNSEAEFFVDAGIFCFTAVPGLLFRVLFQGIKLVSRFNRASTMNSLVCVHCMELRHRDSCSLLTSEYAVIK